MKTIYFIVFAALLSSCASDKKNASKIKSTNILTILSIETVDKILYIIKPPSAFRGQFENQTQLLIDSVNNKWTDDKKQKRLFITDFPEIILDSFPPEITTSCCQGSSFLILNSKQSHWLFFDSLNKNMININGKWYCLKTNTLTNLTKYLNKTIKVKEEIILNKNDTSNLDAINKILSFKRDIFIDDKDRPTIIKYSLE